GHGPLIHTFQVLAPSEEPVGERVLVDVVVPDPAETCAARGRPEGFETMLDCIGSNLLVAGEPRFDATHQSEGAVDPVRADDMLDESYDELTAGRHRGGGEQLLGSG